MSRFISVSVLCFYLYCHPAVGLIINTDNDSFIDLNTRLEWMDFGINNHETFTVVKNKTLNGGAYDSWRVATETEIKELWFNAFFSANPRLYRPNQYGPGWGNAADWTEAETTFSTLWTPIFEVMGYNTILRLGEDAEQQVGFGYYEADNGSLYRAQFVNYTNWNILNAEREFYDSASLFSYDYVEARHDHNISFSTMLVRPVKVSEPSQWIVLLSAFSWTLWIALKKRTLSKKVCSLRAEFD